MNYVVSALVAAVAATVTAAFENKKGGKGENAWIKALSIVLFGFYFLRCFSYDSELIGMTLRVKGYSSLALPAGGTFGAVSALAGEWLSLAAAMAAVLKGFFKTRTLDRAVLFAMPVYCVINTVFFGNVISVSMGGNVNIINFPSVCYAAESGIITYLTVYYWYRALRDKDFPAFTGYKSAGVFAACLVLGILSAAPNYWCQFLFGASVRQASLIKGFGFEHRLLLYGGVLLPMAAYFAVRHLEEKTVKCALLYFTLTAMFVYCYTQSFYGLIHEPTSWPLHLCNTAMFLLPLCIVFGMKRLFYFTYFINVFGAVMAMLMPNYGDEVRINSAEIIRFWYNHYYAFYMPLVTVALKQFPRPTVKQFRYSMIGFVIYFVFALSMNVILRGFGYTPDYFFLVGDHIVGTLGDWAKKIYDVTLGFTVGGRSFSFRPVYQALFFVLYVGFGLGMWFVYEIGFSLADAHGRLTDRRRKIKLDKFALEAALDGRSIEEPMNNDAGIKLELKHFSKKYSTSKVYAVSDASFEVRGGEIFGCLGPNGAGKSTIIKSIVGIQPITEGAIEVCGYDCEKQPVQAKRLIGYVPDHYALYEKLTGREYINYIADIYNVSKEDRTERIERHIKMFELQGSIDNPIKTYSHGMKQKITIMAALVHDPKLWILDEPLTGLDPNSIFQVKECMRQHAEAGNIVFFSSHIIDVVERICDRITIIKKGKILVTRDVADIEKECPLEEYYLRMINGENGQK